MKGDLMGINYADLVVGVDQLPYIPVETLRAGSKLQGVITCTKPFECYTHFIGYRTLPCLTPACGGCDLHRPKKYEAFVSLCSLGNHRHSIIRLTPNAMTHFKMAVKSVDDCRGLIVEVERKGQRANGRLVVSVSDKWIPSHKLPERPDLERHLLNIWRIDGIRPSDDEQAYLVQYAEFTKTALEKGGKSHADEPSRPVAVSKAAR